MGVLKTIYQCFSEWDELWSSLVLHEWQIGLELMEEGLLPGMSGGIAKVRSLIQVLVAAPRRDTFCPIEEDPGIPYWLLAREPVIRSIEPHWALFEEWYPWGLLPWGSDGFREGDGELSSPLSVGDILSRQLTFFSWGRRHQRFLNLGHRMRLFCSFLYHCNREYTVVRTFKKL